MTGNPARESDWVHPDRVYALTFNRSGTRLATACRDNQARVFATNDTTRPAPLFAVDHQPDSFFSPVPSVQAPVFCDGDGKVVTIQKTGQPGWCEVETGHSEPAVWKPAFASCNRSLASSPDGKRVAIAGRLSCLAWNVDGESVEFKHRNIVTQAVVNPDGHSLLTTCWDGTARLWPIPLSGREPVTFPQMHEIANGIFSPDGSLAAIATSRQLVIWPLPKHDVVVGRIAAWPDRPQRPRPGFDGRLVTPGRWHESPHAPSAASNTLSVAFMSSGQPAGPTISLEGSLVDSSLCADNRTVAAACESGSSGSLSLFDVATGRRRFASVALPSPPISVAARPGKPHVAVLCKNGQLCVIHTENGSRDVETAHDGWLAQAAGPLLRVEYSPDGNSLVTVAPKNLVFVRDAQTGRLRYPPWSPVLEGGPFRTMAFSPDSRLLATGVNGKNAVEIWDLATGKLAAPPLPHPGDAYGIFSVAFSPDGRLILSGHKDGQLRLWDWKSGRLVVPPMQHPDEVYDCKFTADGRHALAAVRQSTVYVWDLANGKLAAPPIYYPVDYELDTSALGIAGERVVASAPGYPVIDLSRLLEEPAGDTEHLLRRAELATKLRLQLGELETLLQSDWDERWATYGAR